MGYYDGVLRHVGIGRPYATIQSAVDASSTNDSILIDHGVYNEAVILDDIINIKGGSPIPGGVRIVSPNENPPIKVNTLGAGGNLYIESVEVEGNVGNWQRGIELDVSIDCSSLHVYISKCRVITTGKRFCIGLNTNPLFSLGGLYVTNCYLERGYSHVAYMDQITNTLVSGTECNNPFLTYNGDPNVEDTVYVPTSGYGTEYGTVIFPWPIYYFSGYVLENSSPVERRVRAYTRTHNKITTYSGGGVHHTGSTISDSTTGEFTVISLQGGKHNIECEDDSFGLTYSDLIASDVTPMVIST